jgi:SWIM zinc finger
MGLQLTSNDQVLALAPDSSSAAAGKKLANAKHWQSLGQAPGALWGECQGSALYQVRIDLTMLTITCSCPSRKLPCKHGLGLLLLTVDTPKSVPHSEPPEWVASWLAKRASSNKRKEPNEPQKTPAAPSSSTSIKNAEKRRALMMKGIDLLDLWLNDLVRSGLASAESRPAAFWEEQRAQMVDAQLEGLGNRVLRLGEIPNSSANWPERLLAELGKLALLSHALRHIEQLEPSLQVDIRQLVGKPIKQEEVTALGETVTDDWFILGQRVNDTEKVREQSTWMLGARTKRTALILQYTFGQTPFAEVFPLGARQNAELTFWPGAAPHRARLEARRGEILPLQERFPGIDTIEEFLRQVASILAQQPWQERFLCTLRDVTPTCHDKGKQGNHWYIRDSSGTVLPLTNDEHWRLLALSGGHPVDFAAEWDGESLHPLGILVDTRYYLL